MSLFEKKCFTYLYLIFSSSIGHYKGFNSCSYEFVYKLYNVGA